MLLLLYGGVISYCAVLVLRVSYDIVTTNRIQNDKERTLNASEAPVPLRPAPLGSSVGSLCMRNTWLQNSKSATKQTGKKRRDPTDLAAGRGTAPPATASRSRPASSPRSRRCTHTRPSQSPPRPRWRPSGRTPCRCRPTTGSSGRPGRKRGHRESVGVVK